MRSGAAGIVAGVVLATGLAAPVAAPAEAASATYSKKKVVVGKTHQGRKILAYFRGDPNAERTFLVLGQMHGDETAGRETALYMIKRLRPRPGTGLWIIPSMNPDGRVKLSRTNARGVDLNRNWPTSGWIRGTKGSRTYGGPKKASERETRAMMRFLKRTKPDYIASLHQPLFGIGKSGKDVRFEKRLAKQLNLRRKYFGVVQGKGTSPTLTGWYNRSLGDHGTAITVEYGHRPSKAFRTWKSAHGLLRAARIHR